MELRGLATSPCVCYVLCRSAYELTPADRAKFVQRIEQVSPYDEGLDAEGNMACPSDFITDLLTDIRHYCDARGVDFAASDRAAYSHYSNERHK